MEPLDEKTLLGLLTRPKLGNRNQIIADCPWCGKEKHFYVNKGVNKKGRINPYDCKRCGVSGSIYTLLAKLDSLHLLKGNVIQEHDKLNKHEFEETLNSIDNFAEIEIPNKNLPKCSKLINIEDDEYNYLLSRKFTEIDFELYSPVKNKINKGFKDYVIIPIYQDFEIKGYVGRYIGINPNKPRYKNSNETEFGHLLGGFDEINKKTKTLILVEGWFDKTSVTTELGLHHIDELKCCTTFGKKISDYQIWLILNKTNIENIILMYDASDAVNDMKKIGIKLDNYFHTMVADTGHEKDPGQLCENEFHKILQNLFTIDEFFFNKIQKKKF